MAEDRVRIIKKIEIEGKQTWALFDKGSFHTYVSKPILERAQVIPLTRPYKVALGGRKIEVKEHYAIHGKIEGLEFDTVATSIDELGQADGKALDAIVGAETMERWEIIPNPKQGTLDLSGLKRAEFTEFFG